MVKIAYVGIMLYLLVTSSFQLFLNPSYARSKGYSRWANRIPNYVLLFLCSVALLLYPFTSFPDSFARRTAVQIEEQYLIGILSILMFHILAIGITFLRRMYRLGMPRSFIAHYFRLFFTRTTDEKDVADIVLAQEYAVIGTFGGFVGLIILSQGVITKSNSLVVFLLSGFVSCLVYLVIAKVNKAHYY